jgi:uncharacterized linocin/CFP29 family protein
MATSGRAIVGWTDQRWAAVQDAASKGLARTAKCRSVVPMGPDQIGKKAIVVPNIGGGVPLAFGADIIASPVHVSVDIRLDDDHVDDDADVLRLIEAGATQLGALEDEEIIRGTPPAWARARALGTRAARFPQLQRGQIGRAAGRAAGGAPDGPGATSLSGGSPRTGQEIIAAIAKAIACLETEDRPGPCGLLLHSQLLAALRVPAVAGASPLIQQVEQLIGSSKIAGTSALAPLALGQGWVGGVLLRLEPAAADIVQTQKLAVTVLDRTNGRTNLRLEEEIVVRVTDQKAIHHIEY